MSLLGKGKGLLASVKEKAAPALQKAAEATKDVREKISVAGAQSKEAKAPVEGAIVRYGVVYLGGLSQYPKTLSYEIGFNILPDKFVFKPTAAAKDHFADMEIAYDKVSKFEIVKRQVSLAESFMADGNTQSLESENNIEITYDGDDYEVVLRLEMLTGMSVHGQAQKCREMLDLLRQNKIYDKLNKPKDAPAAAPVVDIADQIQKLAGLKDAGILTEEEFNTKKAELLAKM
ncbi:MAG: SHOCT domain-containing protein [Clostridiales bacterium]|jgi:hypothetical protein|nr:SHOCT domain-containing protein [Clostridiales bacterium]